MSLKKWWSFSHGLAASICCCCCLSYLYISSPGAISRTLFDNSHVFWAIVRWLSDVEAMVILLAWPQNTSKYKLPTIRTIFQYNIYVFDRHQFIDFYGTYQKIHLLGYSGYWWIEFVPRPLGRCAGLPHINS